jgi:hypothetical protein
MTSYVVVANSILGTNANGLLIDLHLHDFMSTTDAILYYNYIALLAIMIWAGFASAGNEGRYLFSTPFLASFLIWIGWLRAPTPSAYWGSILCCLFLGAVMYINDLNHEKHGIAGPGSKLIGIAVFIICFSACFGFVQSSNLVPLVMNSGNSQNTMCGTAYTCDEGGNIVLGASVSAVTKSGTSLFGTLTWLGEMALYTLLTIGTVIGSVLFFSVIFFAAYPVFLDSPQVIALMGVINVAMWILYALAYFQWTAKPMAGTGDL